jgi:hypothetical protein
LAVPLFVNFTEKVWLPPAESKTGMLLTVCGAVAASLVFSVPLNSILDVALPACVRSPLMLIS